MGVSFWGTIGLANRGVSRVKVIWGGEGGGINYRFGLHMWNHRSPAAGTHFLNPTALEPILQGVDYPAGSTHLHKSDLSMPFVRCVTQLPRLSMFKIFVFEMLI